MSATDVILSDASEGIYVYQTSFRISYTNREPVPVQEVIKSLQALQGILPKVPDLIEGWLDVKISHGEFFIESLETGSLIEDILMKLYFANQEELDAFMAKIRSNPMLRNSLAGLALGVLVTWGAMTALGSKTPANQVTIANSTIINVGAQQTGLTPEAFEAVVRQAVGDQKKKVAENAVKLVHPAKADPQAEFQISGTTEPQKADQPVLRMTPEQVAAVPVDEKTDGVQLFDDWPVHIGRGPDCWPCAVRPLVPAAPPAPAPGAGAPRQRARQRPRHRPPAA